MKLESFINKCVDSTGVYSTQIYETFSQCLIEFLRYYKECLNKIGVELIKKGIFFLKIIESNTLNFLRIYNFKEQKFTLVDFLIKIRESFFVHFDLLAIIMKQIDKDLNRPAYAKSINLILAIHKLLIDAYASHNYAPIEAKFLIWIFVKLLKLFLTWIDTFIHDGKLMDTKNELGFRRNSSIQIDTVQYWKNGYDMLIDASNLDYEIPLFMRIILTCSFKICKHMEIITLLGNFNHWSNIYKDFLSKLKSLCPYLDDSKEKSELELIAENLNNRSIYCHENNDNQILTYSILELNARKLMHTDMTIIRKSKNDLVYVEFLFENHKNQSSLKSNEINFNLDKELEKCLHECLITHVEYSAKCLIEKLFEKYHVYRFFEFLHSYFLFKSNEIIFLFCKDLFETIKSYETYQEDAILNNLFYKSASSVFTTDILQKKLVFNSNLVTLQYDTSVNSMQESKQFEYLDSNSSRLINFIKLKIKILWPLNIIITKTDLETYNRIFLYIMQIKQVKYDLDSLNIKG
jgi:hypothetical protein